MRAPNDSAGSARRSSRIFKARAGGTAEEVIAALLETKQPLEFAALAAQCNLPAAEAGDAVASLVESGTGGGDGGGRAPTAFHG